MPEEKPGAFARIAASTGEVLDRKGVREFPPGTRFTLDLPGGGGFGHPHQRDPQAVLDDVLDGLVSIEAARDAFAIVIDPETMTIDRAATEQARGNDPPDPAVPSLPARIMVTNSPSGTGCVIDSLSAEYAPQEQDMEKIDRFL